MFLSLVKRFIRALTRKILFPKLNGNYYYISRDKIYRAPSLRQISIIRQFVKAAWIPSSFKTVEKVLEIASVSNPIIQI
jgi:hypothetical protein